MTRTDLLNAITAEIDMMETVTLREGLRCMKKLGARTVPKRRTSYHDWLFARGVEAGGRRILDVITRAFDAEGVGIPLRDVEARPWPPVRK